MKLATGLAAKFLLVAAGLFTVTLLIHAGPGEDGAAIYKQRCSMCHGADGKGFAAIKTPDFTDPNWQKSVTNKQMIEVIENGKKGTAMPSFKDKLKDDEIQAVVAYIRSLDSSKKK
jgi:cytochrome c oxidase cbb3-type subunit III